MNTLTSAIKASSKVSKQLLALFVLSVVLTGCGGGGNSTPADFNPTPVTLPVVTPQSSVVELVGWVATDGSGPPILFNKDGNMFKSAEGRFAFVFPAGSAKSIDLGIQAPNQGEFPDYRKIAYVMKVSRGVYNGVDGMMLTLTSASATSDPLEAQPTGSTVETISVTAANGTASFVGPSGTFVAPVSDIAQLEKAAAQCQAGLDPASAQLAGEAVAWCGQVVGGVSSK